MNTKKKSGKNSSRADEDCREMLKALGSAMQRAEIPFLSLRVGVRTVTVVAGEGENSELMRRALTLLSSV